MASTKKKAKVYEPGTLAFLAILGIILIALGVISLLSVAGGLQGAVFTQVKQVMQGLGGGLCVGLSVLFIWIGVLVAFSSGRNMPKRGLALITVLYMAVLAIYNLLSKVGDYSFMEAAVNYNNSQSPPVADAAGYWSVIKASYIISAGSGFSGGALGMLMAWPACTFLGTTFSVVLMGLVCVLCVLLFSKFDFLQAFESMREGSEERRARKQQEEAQRQYEQMVMEQQQQAAAAEANLQNPAYLRRGRKNADSQPGGEMPMAYPDYSAMLQPTAAAPYLPVMGYPQMPVPQPMPETQPELYNEIIMPQDKQLTWRRNDKKKDKDKPAKPYQTTMTFTPSEVGVPATQEAQTSNNAVILSGSKRKAMERIEEIRKRKAEISAELDGNRMAQDEDMVLQPIIAQPGMMASQPVEIIDRNEAYKRPVPIEEQHGPIVPVGAAIAPIMAQAPAAAATPSAIPAAGASALPISMPAARAAVPSSNAVAQHCARQSYVYPSIELLNLQQRKVEDTRVQDRENASRLEKTLESFSIPAKVQRVTHGPAITRFEMGLVSSGINVKRILSIADNIALDMAANGGVRIEIPIPGTNLFGIEVPNKEIQSVSLAEVLLSPEMKNAKSPLTVALGRDIAGRAVLCDLSKMPHLLIAGQTGSGKSVCINAIINSLLFRSSPEEVRMIMIDPKVVELQCYNAIPHLLIPVVSDPHKAAGALSWAVAEMLDRYHKMQQKNVREMNAYNAKLEPGEEKMPRIVIIIDELADLMLACKKDVEESIIRLAQLARAAGIHMVVATQRPTVDVITGLIKANIPSRIAFAVSSSIDSRTILDQNGAEKLLGRGDMFYFPTGASAPTRVQGCFLSDAETERVVEYIGQHSQVDFDPNIIEAMENEDEAVNPLSDGGDDSGIDDRLAEAIDMVINDGQASISMLQRRMKIGYARAGRLIDDMAARGVVSKSVGSKPREVLMSREEFERIKSTLC